MDRLTRTPENRLGPTAGNDDSALPDTEVHFLASEHVGDEFRVIVGACEGAPPGAGLLVVTDAVRVRAGAGDGADARAVGAHQAVARCRRRLPLDQLADTVRLRTRDFTPSTDDRYTEVDAAMTGGADRFGRFLSEELQPWIAGRYDVDTAGAGVFGYSLGGLFCAHLLLTRPGPFRRFGIGSPSLWWGRRGMIATEQAYADAHDDLDARVYVSVGAYETPAGDDRHREQMTPEARAASLEEEARFPMEDLVGYTRDFAEGLRGRGYPRLELEFEVLPGEYHPTAPPLTFSRAIRYLYDGPH